MRSITIAIIVMVSLGCATMFNRSAQQRVLVTSTPPGAEVFVDGDPVGTTPTSVVVRESDAPEVRLESDGQSRQVRISRRMSPWLWADPSGRGADKCAAAPPEPSRVVHGASVDLAPSRSSTRDRLDSG